jgi:Tfp pilus assembly protein PilP/Tfp pilus assembly protein PilO
MRGAGWAKLNPRQPWAWPVLWQRVSLAVAIVIGALLVAPWWLRAWDACNDAQESAQALTRTQLDIRDAQQRRAQLEQALAQHLLDTSVLVQTASAELPAVSQALTQLAERESLSLSLVDWSAAVPVSALKKGPLHHVPVHLQLHGAWPAWMRWWTQLPEVVPLATLSRLDLQAQAHGGWRAHVVLHMPQRLPEPVSITQAASDWQLAGAPSALASEVGIVDPVDARAWQHTQSQHAQQHPSYARWMAPELQRTRTPLEALPRERLRYVGQISQAGVQQALLRGFEAVGAATHAPIYRVSVGDYVGQDFGRVQTIAADQLTLRELVRDAHGVWQPRDVTLPLEDGAK